MTELVNSNRNVVDDQAITAESVANREQIANRLRRQSTLATVAATLLGIAAASTSSASAADASGDKFVLDVNAKRVAGTVCKGGKTWDWTNSKWVDFPTTQTTASAPLVRNASLDRAAAAALEPTVLSNLFNGAGVGDLIAPTGYLPWISQFFRVYGYANQTEEFWATRDGLGESCTILMSGEFTEIGVAKGPVNNDGSYNLAYILANPFDPNKVSEYRQAIIEAINAKRAAGTTHCPISNRTGADDPPRSATPMPVMPPLLLDDGISQIAQGHSNDMATWPYKGQADPHSGSNGSTTAQRLSACSLTDWRENVATSASSPTALVDGWIGLSPGHCQTLFADMTYAGIGIAQAGPMVGAGTGPFATLVVSKLGCGGTQPPLKPPPPPVLPSKPGALVLLDPNSRYRLYPVSRPDLLLTMLRYVSAAQRRDARATQPGIFDKFAKTDTPVLLTSVDDAKAPIGERHVWWNAVPAPDPNFGGLQALLTDASCVDKLTVSRTYPPVFMGPVQRAALPRDQGFRITQVDGTEYVQIAAISLSREATYLSAEPTGEVSWIFNPTADDKRTWWKLDLVSGQTQATPICG